MDVSIIIVNWNTRDILGNCLRSIYDQTNEVEYEVVVIDNASSDDSAAMVRAEFPQVVLIENSNNLGFAAANNQGMAIAGGRYVLLLNSDTIVLDGAIQKTISYADDHQDIGVLGCQVWENEREIQKTCFAFPSAWGVILQKMGLRRLFPRSRVFGRIDYGWWDRTSPMDVDVVSGMFMLVRKYAIDQVGLMDEDYFVYAEETDWCFRFKKNGWRCVFAPVARIIHLDGGNKSTDLVKVKMCVQMQKSVLLFFKKHHSVIQYFLARLILTAYTGLRCLAFTLMLIGRIIVGKDVNNNLKESRSHWSVFKYCAFGIEPERVSRES